MTATFEVGSPGWHKIHLANYLETDGADGHYLDFRPAGGGPKVPTMILKTVGRKSGDTHLTPLIYGMHGDEVVIIGSRGGHHDHPAWYLNIQAAKELEFQVADKKWRGTWRVAEGAERAEIWKMMVGIYAPFADYQVSAGNRQIPVILLKPVTPIAKL